MKPSIRYQEIYKVVPVLFPGIKEPYHSVKAMLLLLDELHPEPTEEKPKLLTPPPPPPLPGLPPVGNKK